MDVSRILKSMGLNPAETFAQIQGIQQSQQVIADSLTAINAHLEAHNVLAAEVRAGLAVALQQIVELRRELAAVRAQLAPADPPSNLERVEA